MAISHITIAELGQDAQGKCNDLMDATQVSGNMITGDILEITRFDSSTYQIQLPYSINKVNVGLVTSIIGAGPYSTSTTTGSYQIGGVIFSIGVVTNFPIPAAPVIPDNRIDLIVGDNLGVLSYINGVANPNPTPPIVPSNSVAIAYIYVPNVGSPYIYDISTYGDSFAGTLLGTHLNQNGSNQTENLNERFVSNTFTLSDSNISSSQDDAVNSYNLSATKTLTNLNQFRYSDNNYADLSFQNCEFNLSSLENGTDNLSEIKTFGTTGQLNLRNYNNVTTYNSYLNLNATTPKTTIGITSGADSEYGLYFRKDNGGQVSETTLVSGNYNALTSDYFIGVNSSGGSYSIVLPVAQQGQEIVVKDTSGNSFLNPIIISASGGLLIDGSLTKRLQYNYGSMTFVKLATTQAVKESHNQSSQATTGSYGLYSRVDNTVGLAVLANTQTAMPTIVAPNGTLTTSLSNFTSLDDYRIGYIAGASGRYFEINASVTLTVNANNRLLSTSLWRNGAILTGTTQKHFVNTSGNYVNIAMTWIEANVVGGDYFDLYVRSSGANTITVSDYSIKVIELQRI